MRRSFAPAVFVSLCLVFLVSCQQPLNLDSAKLLADAKQHDVRILRDSWGVPHIFGATDADTAFGFAYAHCEDDFATIQEGLLVGRSELASVKGKEAVVFDFMVQMFRVWDAIDEKYEKDLSPQTRAVCEAYAEGANLYAALHPEAILKKSVFPATGKDIVAGFVLCMCFSIIKRLKLYWIFQK